MAVTVPFIIVLLVLWSAFGYGGHTMRILIDHSWLTLGAHDGFYTGIHGIINLIMMILYALDFYTAPHLYDRKTGTQRYFVMGRTQVSVTGTLVGRFFVLVVVVLLYVILYTTAHQVPIRPLC